jgi:pimeloyl-ACP methyl ester carboxylesterase
MDVVGLPFGDGLMGELFYPLGPDGKQKPGKWPVVIWLHPYSYQNGWSAGRPWVSGSVDVQDQDERPSFPLLAKRGFAVFAFDQLGFGARVHEIKHFYDRYPRWSILGNMIEDTRAAVDALSNLEEIDSSRIFLLGYALGAKIGLLTAGFEDRVKGIVSICGVDTLRKAEFPLISMKCWLWSRRSRRWWLRPRWTVTRGSQTCSGRSRHRSRSMLSSVIRKL